LKANGHKSIVWKSIRLALEELSERGWSLPGDCSRAKKIQEMDSRGYYLGQLPRFVEFLGFVRKPLGDLMPLETEFGKFKNLSKSLNTHWSFTADIAFSLFLRKKRP